VSTVNILQVISTVNPADGGMPSALLEMQYGLESLGHRTATLTLDSPKAPWIATLPGVVFALGPSYLRYHFNSRLMEWLNDNISRYDGLIVHGIWQYTAFAVMRSAVKCRKPYLIFVHGQLDPWFKSRYPLKHVKKWLYWPWGSFRILRDAAAVLFTSEEERALSRESFWLYTAREEVVGYGIRKPAGDPSAQKEAFLAAFPFLRDRRLILFISRIQAKKGCDLLIEAFANAAREQPELDLVMAGPDQEGWRARLECRAEELGIADRIIWTGMLTGDLKWGSYRAAEVFVLPSHSENFGLVVVEALACGLPVLITDKVNIRNYIREDGAGLVGPDTLDGINSLLQQWLGLSPATRERMAFRAKLCFEKRFEIRQVAEKLVRTFERGYTRVL
jgi:glycosyltransferase involved in cell wall biosynthesis